MEELKIKNLFMLCLVDRGDAENFQKRVFKHKSINLYGFIKTVNKVWLNLQSYVI